MYLDNERMKSGDISVRIQELIQWCRDNKHSSIPKLIQFAEDTGGIKEDVLQFFEENREMDIKRDLYTAFERLLYLGEPVGVEWYKLLMAISRSADDVSAGMLLDEAVSAYRASMPHDEAAIILKCGTVEEFVKIRHQYEQKDLKEEAEELILDVEFYKEQYRSIKKELDKVSLENAELNKALKALEQMRDDTPAADESGQDIVLLREEDSVNEETAKDTAELLKEETEDMPFSEYADTFYIEEMQEAELQEKGEWDAAEVEQEELSAMLSQSYGYDRQKLPEIPQIFIEDLVEDKQSKTAVILFGNIVKKICTRKFRRSTELEQRRKIIAGMTTNNFSPERQNLIVQMLKSGRIPWEHIYTYVYDDASLEELKDIAVQNGV